MDPVVGSVDIVESNSNSAGCLINLCSLCNLQFSDHAETDNDPEVAKVEKILDIFLSDDDEHGQVQLCLNCKLLCTELICTKQSLLFIIDKITTLLLQNSRFTLVNPKYKIIPKLFQFRFTKASPPTSSSVSRPRTSFGNSNSVCGLRVDPEIVADSANANQQQCNSNFSAVYVEVDQRVRSACSNTSADTAEAVTNETNQTTNALMYQVTNEMQVEIPTPTDSRELTLNTPPFLSNYEMATVNMEKHDDLLLTDLDGLNFPIDPPLSDNMHILGNETMQEVASYLEENVGHVKTSPEYMCEICGKSYQHKKRLEVHISGHKKEAKFQCSVCLKTFTQKSGLQRHLPIHTGELPFKCTLCDKQFRHHSSLNIHKLTHSGKRQFSCHSCDISFISTSHLRRHQKSHTGVKPFSCKICPRTFCEKYNLDSHVRTHTGETAYKCPHCPLGFNRKKKLRHHMISDHLVK